MSGKSLYFIGAIGVFAIGQNFVQSQSPVSSTLTYQGQLKQNDRPVTDTCDFEFNLWNDPIASDPANLIAGPAIFSDADAIVVKNGLFTATLDFGLNLFGDEDRWLGILVRCPAGSVEWTTLSPRQRITPAPFALALPGFKTQPNDIAPNVIGGSKTNFVAEGIAGATISGGNNNSVGGQMGTVVGGDNNKADGDYSLAAGHRAKALHDGSFVWSDSVETDFSSTEPDQFLIRAHGGVGLGTTDTTHQLTIASPQVVDQEKRDNTLRLLGPDGGFNHGARLNFGDANWVYLDEDIDDGLNIHAARRISLTGGNVGIGTITPTGLLEVFGAVGNGSVVFPKDAISSEEMLNESGVASSVLSADSDVGRCTVAIDSTLRSIRSRQLSAPADGFVMVIATARIDIAHTNLITSEAIFGVSTLADSLPQNQQMGVLIDGGAPTGTYHHTLTVHGLFNTNAGDTMYHLLAQQVNGDIRVCDIQLSLMYFPTAYGIVEPSDPGGFQSRSHAPPPVLSESINQQYAQLQPPLSDELILLEIKKLRDEIDRLQQRVEYKVIGLKNNR